jgi:hypothetical protein
MSDRKALAREIAGRSTPRFIEIKPELRNKVSRPSSRRFVEIARERRSGVPFTEEELTAIRGGLSAEEYRRRVIRKHLKK